RTRFVWFAAWPAYRTTEDRGASQSLPRLCAGGDCTRAADSAESFGLAVLASRRNPRNFCVHGRCAANRRWGFGFAWSGGRTVSYEPRTYDQIVRDILTTLTGGTVRETVTAPAGNAVITPDKLKNRPVRRVSSLDGVIGTPDKPVDYRFTAADFELISTSSDDSNKDAIR